MLASVAFEDESGRREPSWVDDRFRFVREAVRETESTMVGSAVAEMDDMAGGALAE